MSQPGTPLTALSGQDCPCSGVWRARSTTLPPLLVQQGDIMPAAHGRIVTWELLRPHAANPFAPED